MNDMKRLSAAFKLKQITDEGEIAGYASVFDVVDRHDDIVVRGAFARTLEEARRRGKRPKLLWQHMSSEPLGVWQTLTEDSTGLYVEGRLLVGAVNRAREAHALLKAGAIDGLSIGFITRKDEYDSASGIRRLIDVDLLEVSLVTFPANEEATVTDVKNLSKRDWEQILRGNEPLPHLSTKQAKAFVAKGMSGLHCRDGGADADADQPRDGVAHGQLSELLAQLQDANASTQE